MKKFMLAAITGAIATGWAGMAAAAVNLDTGTGSGGVYASELVIPVTTGTALGAGAAADQSAVTTLGATFGSGQQAFIRYDLGSGTFVGAPTLTPQAGLNRVAQISQGGAGQNYVIFAISPATAADIHLGAGETVTLVGNGINVTNQNAVTVQYRLYETLTAAVNQTPQSALKTVSGTLVSFANAINTVFDTTPDAVADVAAANGPYTAFVPLAGSPTYSRQVSNWHVTYTQRALANGAPTAGAGSILGATNSVTISGDWSAAQNVHLHNAASCSAGSFVTAGTINATKTAATFANLSAAAITANHWYGCFEIAQPNSIAIPVSTYTGLVDLVPANASVTVADAATSTGKIVRNGTVLKAAFAEATSAAGVSSAISLTNNGSRAANFTVKCVLNNGSVAGKPGTLPANTAQRFGLTAANGLACPASNVRGLEITFDVPNGSVIGSVVRQNTSTGAAAFDGMVGNQ